MLENNSFKYIYAGYECQGDLQNTFSRFAATHEISVIPTMASGGFIREGHGDAMISGETAGTRAQGQ